VIMKTNHKENYMLTQELIAFREKLVRDHFEDEVKQDWNSLLSTFPHPHYELIATGAMHDGRDDVMNYHMSARTAFPNQHHELISLRHTDDAVICEFWLIGTHKGYLGSMPPTGNTFRIQVCAFFLFEGETLVCERIYFDTLSIVKQLLKGFDLKSPSGIYRGYKTVTGLLANLKDLSKVTKGSVK
jgi:predicted ester cyclase